MRRGTDAKGPTTQERNKSKCELCATATLFLIYLPTRLLQDLSGDLPSFLSVFASSSVFICTYLPRLLSFFIIRLSIALFLTCIIWQVVIVVFVNICYGETSYACRPELIFPSWLILGKPLVGSSWRHGASLIAGWLDRSTSLCHHRLQWKWNLRRWYVLPGPLVLRYLVDT